MTTPAPPSSKTMFNYFTKLPSKACIVEETNPRKLAPAFNKQHVEEFTKNKLKQFDAELQLQLIPTNNECEQIIYLPNNGTTKNYIQSIQTGQHKPFKIRKRLRGALRSRLFQYCEDVRPPFFGTWQKRSKIISGRRPFATDTNVFDYEVDSEAEWDIGGPGESLKGDDSEDEDPLDDYEIDMKTFVPHGYVSDDEIEVHSDQEENQSANQSLEVCDDGEESNVSVKIIGEKNCESLKDDQQRQRQADNQQQTKQQQPNTNGRHNNNNTNSHHSPIQVAKQSKLDIKPIALGLNYENAPHPLISESKLQFLKAFQGFSCS